MKIQSFLVIAFTTLCYVLQQVDCPSVRFLSATAAPHNSRRLQKWLQVSGFSAASHRAMACWHRRPGRLRSITLPSEIMQHQPVRTSQLRYARRLPKDACETCNQEASVSSTRAYTAGTAIFSTQNRAPFHFSHY